MNCFDCREKLPCILLAVVSSIIIGVITAFLQITAAITVTPAFLWVVFGVAVVYLAVTLLAAALVHKGASYRCLCSALSSLLAGILGTVLFSVVLLAVEFAATSILGAIITGALLFFFALTITSTACLVKCLVSCGD